MAVKITDDMLGRASLIAPNLLRGDPLAAGRAAISPLSLSPEEAKSLRERLGLGDGPFAWVFETLTNPLVLLGAALSIKFPIPKLKNMMGVSKQLRRASESSYLPPALRGFSSPFSIYKDRTDVLEALLDVGLYRTKFVERHYKKLLVAEEEFRRVAGRPMTRLEERLVAYHLDGLTEMKPKSLQGFRKVGSRDKLETPLDLDAVEKHTSPALREFVGKVRGVLDDMYDEVVLLHPDMRVELTAALTKRVGKKVPDDVIEQILKGERKIEAEVRGKLRASDRFKNIEKELKQRGFVEPGVKLDAYWPHMLPRDLKGYEDWLQEMVSASKFSTRSLGKRAVAGLDKTASENLLKRQGKMLPDVRHLEEFPELLHAGRMNELKKYFLESGAGTVRPYRLDFLQTIELHTNRMGTSYAFNVRGAGRKLAAARDTLDTWRASLLENHLIPMAAGRATLQKAVKSQYLMGVKDRVRGLLDTPYMKKVLGGDLHKWMTKRMQLDRGGFSNMEEHLTSLIYSGALGANVGSVGLNLTQSLITTIPLLGTDAFRGMSRAIGGLKRYGRLRIHEGADHLTALQKTFPRFAEMGLGGATKFGSEAVRSLDEAFRMSERGVVRRGFDRLNNFLMFAFEKVELFNQLSAFEGAMVKGLREGLSAAEAMPLARNITMMTQFPVDVVNSPVYMQMLKGMPGGKLLSMFSQFTMRTLEFMTSTATSLGSIAQSDPLLGRNWGTLGRVMLTSGLVYEMGKEAGVDLSRGLMFGALPEVREGRPFSPLPIVPPAASIAGGVVQDLVRGKFDETRYGLPLLVPGGVAVSRVASLFSPEAAKVLGRKWVDYDSPTPGGDLPMYGQVPGRGAPTLVGYVSPSRVLLHGLGLPSGAAEQEVEGLRWLMKNRDRILGYKRGFMQALLENDPGRATSVDETFRKAYPQLRGGLRTLVKKRDLEAMELRRNVARMERVLETLPREMRPLFAQALQQTVLSNTEGLLGVDPRLLQRGTIRSRAPYRVDQSPYQRNLAGMEGRATDVDPRSLSRRPLPNVGGY